jgi:hypothetical protein
VGQPWIPLGSNISYGIDFLNNKTTHFVDRREYETLEGLWKSEKPEAILVSGTGGVG